MKILLVFNDVKSGSNFYRLEMPHHHLGENYPCKIFAYEKESDLDDDSYDFVIFNRFVSLNFDTRQIIEKLKKHTKVILDIDDYWNLGHNHLLYNDWKENKTGEQYREAVMLADGVIATTKYLAAECSKLNKNVWVIPNAVFPEVYYQFKHDPIERSDMLRLGWLGGVCHIEDIELLYDLAQKVYFNQDKVKFFFSHGENQVYEYYKRIITNNYRNFNYERMPTTDVYRYAFNYSLFDVALAPLNKGKFNECKSELKVIEAGFHKKGLIVSKTRPYTDICNSKNSIICEYEQDWYKAVKRLLRNPDLVDDLGSQLYEDIQKFHISEVNKLRWEVYQFIKQMP